MYRDITTFVIDWLIPQLNRSNFTKIGHFKSEKLIFLCTGHGPLPKSLPQWDGDPLPTPTPQRLSRRLRSSLNPVLWEFLATPLVSWETYSCFWKYNFYLELTCIFWNLTVYTPNPDWSESTLLTQGPLVGLQNYSTTSNASAINSELASKTTVYRPFWWIFDRTSRSTNYC